MDADNARTSLFREWEFWLSFAILVAVYAIWYDRFPLVGEETRYAQVAIEMADLDDWVVPRELGRPFLSRPPIIFWLMGAMSWLTGDMGVLAIRAASLAGIVATGMMIYVFARSWLSRSGSLIAVLFWTTFPELLIANRKAEAEALFTFSVSLCLFGWHAAYRRRWSPARLWLLGYSLAGLATMIKGPQAPLYFGATTWLFLAWRRDWKTLVHPGQLLGMAAFAGIIALWMVPYCLREGVEAAYHVWSADSVNRFRDHTIGKIFEHLAMYPIDVASCTMPWSIFLLAYASGRLRKTPDSESGHRAYLAIAVLVGFLPCWLTPGGMTRYFQPLYPALAILMAWPVERFVVSGERSRVWAGYWRLVAVGVAGMALGLIGVSVGRGAIRSDMLLSWVQSPLILTILTLLAAIAVVCLWRTAVVPATTRNAVLAFTAFFATLNVTAWLDSIRARVEPVEAEIAALKASLPPGQPAYFTGYVHHRFTYFHRDRLKRIDFGDLAKLKPDEYVCVNLRPGVQMSAPVDFEIVSTISMDRRRRPDPEEVTVVFRVLEPKTIATPPAGFVRPVSYHRQ